MKVIIALTVLLMACGSNEKSPSKTNLVTKEVTYNADGITMKGFMAWSDSIQVPRPGVIVVHEWWGLNEHARESAGKLAELGYVAFALDMFGEGKVANHPDDARAFTQVVRSNFDGAKTRFYAALDVLKADTLCNQRHLAAIGYCFGGGIVLNMARQGADLDAVASFHGSLSPVEPAVKGVVHPQVLVLNGAADSMVSQASIDAFKTEMDSAGVDYDFVNYPGAKHAFTNPASDSAAAQFGMNVAYNKEADEESWKRLTQFLEEVFAE